ncbi:DUF2568 domain-containing protein [Nakamurella alba]|uniref:DUF2568 domain-containing protein n=1 Tax=Nakamurella alba TaxID=2665158 RepID=UPI0012B9E728|nr:DUF2568 domain-containing protein [Nakamurella alba]
MTDRGPLDGASPALAVALTVRFLAELAVLVGVAVLVSSVTSGWWRWPAAALAVVAVAVLWGRFLSPKAAVAIPPAAALGIEAALFLGTGLGLVLTGRPIPAVIGAVVWALDRLALAILRR